MNLELRSRFLLRKTYGTFKLNLPVVTRGKFCRSFLSSLTNRHSYWTLPSSFLTASQWKSMGSLLSELSIVIFSVSGKSSSSSWSKSQVEICSIFLKTSIIGTSSDDEGLFLRLEFRVTWTRVLWQSLESWSIFFKTSFKFKSNSRVTFCFYFDSFLLCSLPKTGPMGHVSCVRQQLQTTELQRAKFCWCSCHFFLLYYINFDIFALIFIELLEFCTWLVWIMLSSHVFSTFSSQSFSFWLWNQDIFAWVS